MFGKLSLDLYSYEFDSYLFLHIKNPSFECDLNNLYMHGLTNVEI